MHLATSDGDQPWLAHVWYASNSVLELFFLSNRGRRHSGELERNARVAGGMVALPELVGLGQTVRGVTFAGVAGELDDEELVEGYHVYADRWPQVETLVPLSDMRTGVSPMRIYRVVVQEYVLFDELRFPGSPRQRLTDW